MAKQDYYELLGVAKTATADDLKKAYRKLAMRYHPDRNAGDKAAEQRFKEINEAYDVLRDDQKRAAYDRFGHAAFENGRGNAGGFDTAAGGFADIFEEMFGDFMGGGQRRGGRRRQGGRGADVRFDLEITLEDAFAGREATVKVPSSVPCDICKGSGAEPGSQPATCPTCGGAGQVRMTQGGFFTVQRTCPTCSGAGRVIRDPCKNCAGSGRIRRDKTLKVDIPSGVEDGTRIRLAAEGEAGVDDAPAGDLYIFLSIKPHPFFQRDGADLYCRVPIPMTTAALGGGIEVPTIDGSRTKLSVTAGTQTAARFRLRGKGMSVLRSNTRGDMYVELQVETPVGLTKRQRELLEEFEREGGGGASPESQGFFARVKEFFGELGKE
jgi:molecular chaperone DnaJ